MTPLTRTHHRRPPVGRINAEQVTHRVAEIIWSLQAPTGVDDTFKAITNAATACIPVADVADILLAPGHDLDTAVRSGGSSTPITALHTRTRQGPQWQALRRRTTVRSPDLAADPRWPEFGSHADQLGLRSVLALPLPASSPYPGAFGVYSHRPHAFNVDHETTAALLTALTAAALQQHQLIESVSHHDIIGQAAGVLMERRRITADAAYDLLRQAAKNSDRKLHQIAGTVAGTGQDPEGIEPSGESPK